MHDSACACQTCMHFSNLSPRFYAENLHSWEFVSVYIVSQVFIEHLSESSLFDEPAFGSKVLKCKGIKAWDRWADMRLKKCVSVSSFCISLLYAYDSV